MTSFNKNHGIFNELFHSIFTEVDGILFWKYAANNRIKIGSVAGTLSNEGYIRVKVNGKKFFAHHIVWCMHYGYLPDMIDHINCDRVDNRISNLRLCTTSQNSCNSKIPITNTSGYKNVSWSKKRKAWVVQLQVHGVKKSYGFYADIELAELVAIEVREKYHGVFARHA